MSKADEFNKGWREEAARLEPLVAEAREELEAAEGDFAAARDRRAEALDNLARLQAAFTEAHKNAHTQPSPGASMYR
jgi:hypothetical protein